MNIDVDIRRRGPIFNFRARRALRQYIDEVPYEVAGRGVDIYLTIYRPQVRNPTPYYEYLVKRERVEYAVSKIWDGGEVEYGPWLERGRSDTRFGGYHSFEKATPVIQAEAGSVAEALLRRKYLRRLN